MTQAHAAPSVRTGRFVRRRNRFVAEVALDDGTGAVAAYLPNTARLRDLLIPGRSVVVRPSSDPSRRTAWTLTRVHDGAWVSLEAAVAPRILADHLQVLGWDGEPIVDIAREVRLDDGRVDLVVTPAAGPPIWIEVKSTSRARAGAARLSGTPSTRAAAQIDRLVGGLRSGRLERAALAFVVQRPDVSRLVVDPSDATVDPGWSRTVEAARAGGLTVVAYRADVTPTETRIAGPIPVVWTQ